MTAGQFPRLLHLIPADGAVVVVLSDLILRRLRKPCLHALDDLQVVAVAAHALLNLTEQVSHLHPNYETGHV